MKVMTLWQPYATLIALGVKTIETRGQAFRSLVGQRIAIHAAARRPAHMRRVGRFCVNRKTDGSTVMYDEEWCLANGRDVHIDLPLGAIVCTAVVTDSLPMGNRSDDHIRPVIGGELWLYKGLACADITDQLPYGDFRPGRFGLLLADVEPVEPYAFKGGQGLSRSVDPALLMARGVPSGRRGIVMCPDCQEDRVRDALADLTDRYREDQ